MSEAAGSFEGEGGVEIRYRAWPASGETRAAVVISHGGGEHSGRYEHVAVRLGAAGYRVWAPDHRGHGMSDGERMRFSSVSPMAADLRTMVAIAAREAPVRKPFLLAHSMGAAIGLDYACDHQDELSGIVLSGALAALDQKTSVRLAARAVARLSPGRGIFKVDPETVSRDPAVVAAYDSDPLNFHGSFPAESIVALERVGMSFPKRLPSLALPLLILHGADDRLTPPGGSRLVDELASSPDKTLKLYPGLRHEILNEPERDAIIDEIVAWLIGRS
ncbi:MAG: lysophospholipase [Solirubrobacterales bacterium]